MRGGERSERLNQNKGATCPSELGERKTVEGMKGLGANHQQWPDCPWERDKEGRKSTWWNLGTIQR